MDEDLGYGPRGENVDLPGTHRNDELRETEEAAKATDEGHEIPGADPQGASKKDMSKTEGNFYSAAPGLPPRKFMDKRQGVGTSAQRERPALRLEGKDAAGQRLDPSGTGPSTAKHAQHSSNLPMIKSQ